MTSIEGLTTELGRHLDIAGVHSVYLFGSVLTKETPGDVDVVLVYEEPLAPGTVRAATHALLTDAVSAAASLPAHAVFLSVPEALEPGTLAAWEAVRVLGRELQE
ncbi:MAG TPA: hypothetical protein VGH82_05465 [Gaiellaceae bacterium]|jgi:hypothetical protein